MATIDKRAGHWRAQVRRKGQPVQRATFDTRKQAEDWAKAVEGDMARGRFVDTREAERTTLGEVLKRYERDVTPRKKGASQERYVIRFFRSLPLAGRSMAAIRSKDIADFVVERRAAGVADKTIRNHLAVLSHIFETARRSWGMESLGNPTQLVEKPKAGKPRDRRLVGDEEGRLLEASGNALAGRLRPAVVLAIETAMRQGEIESLRWEHVDLGRRVAHLPDTKTGEARDVPLSPRANETLRALPRRLDGYVLGKADYTHGFEDACKRAGIVGLTFHDLRHEATSRLFESGWNPMEVAAVTGHKTLQMLKRYTHLRAEDLARKMAGERLERYR